MKRGSLSMRHGINIVNLRTVENVEDWIAKGAGNNVYIARETLHHPRSEWCNPFKLKDYGYNRGKVLELFKQYIVRNKKLVQNLQKLKGKVLGCWCAPKRCHGEILHKMAGNLSVYKHQMTSDLTVTSSMDSEGITDNDEDSDTISPIGLLYFAEFCTLRNSKRNSFSCILRNINAIICNLRNKLPCKIRNLCMENCKMRKFRKVQIDMQKIRILQILSGFDSAKYRILS